jgi:tetratricopeptide (TPR) repeat protein
MNATSLSLRSASVPPRVFHHALLGVMLLLVIGLSDAFGATQDVNNIVPNPDYRLPDDTKELLRIDNEMKVFFAARINRKSPIEAKLDEIVDAILGENGLHFGYEGDGVYDVREAFRRRRGNCLTYAMLVVAVAREFGLPAKFNEVLIRPRWDRSGGLILVSRHINVRIETGGNSYELDIKFNDDLRVSSSSAWVVDDARAFSGAYNNVGVYRMTVGDRAEALRLMEKATVIDPTYVPSWINLGCALAISGQLDRAQLCFERALAQEPNAPGAISGLASVHRKMGHIAEAEKLERAAIRYRERNPYYLLKVARSELANGNLASARRHLKRAINIKSDEPELYELMSEVARGQGLESEAKRWSERSKKGTS